MAGSMSVRVLVAAVLAGVAATLGTSILWNRTTASPASAEGDGGSENAELARRIAGLETALIDMRALIERNAGKADLDAAASSARVPVGEPAPPGKDLITRLDGLESGLAALDGRLTALTDADAAKEAAGPLDAMPETFPDRPLDVARLESLRGIEATVTTASHLGWTYDQVGAAYGMPTLVSRASVGRGINYAYKLPEGDYFEFWFEYGKVVKARW